MITIRDLFQLFDSFGMYTRLHLYTDAAVYYEKGHTPNMSRLYQLSSIVADSEVQQFDIDINNDGDVEIYILIL